MEFQIIVTVISAALAVVGAMIGLLTLFAQKRLRERSAAEYDRETRRAELSAMREYYEAQIERITDKLTGTEQRWRDANHLIISAQQNQSMASSGIVSPDRFLSGFGIDINNVSIDKKLVFYLTPFSKAHSSEFEVVLDVCNRNGLTCRRGDEEFIDRNILSHVVKNITSSRLVIANITGRNPNVLYELGIAQALGKPTIIISKTLDDLPFDIQENRVITFKDHEELRRELTNGLVRVLADGPTPRPRAK